MKPEDKAATAATLITLAIMLIVIPIVNFTSALEQKQTYRDIICILEGWEMEEDGRCVVLTGEGVEELYGEK